MHGTFLFNSILQDAYSELLKGTTDMQGVWLSVGPFVYNIIMQECVFFLSRHSYKSILLYKMHDRHVTFKYTLSGLLSEC